jgi:hypothetical protein
VELVAGSQAAVEVEFPASPPVPASFASTTPEKQERRIRVVIVLTAPRLVIAVGPMLGRLNFGTIG